MIHWNNGYSLLKYYNFYILSILYQFLEMEEKTYRRITCGWAGLGAFTRFLWDQGEKILYIFLTIILPNRSTRKYPKAVIYVWSISNHLFMYTRMKNIFKNEKQLSIKHWSHAFGNRSFEVVTEPRSGKKTFLLLLIFLLKRAWEQGKNTKVKITRPSLQLYIHTDKKWCHIHFGPTNADIEKQNSCTFFMTFWEKPTNALMTICSKKFLMAL